MINSARKHGFSASRSYLYSLSPSSVTPCTPCYRHLLRPALVALNVTAFGSSLSLYVLNVNALLGDQSEHAWWRSVWRK